MDGGVATVTAPPFRPSDGADSAAAAPPPPPPPPAPPPPPPPPAGGSPLSRDGAGRKSRMRTINWDVIPRQSVLGTRTVWTPRAGPEDFPLDLGRMEELFGRAEPSRAPGDDSAPAERSDGGPPAFNAAPEAVSILNGKKSMNLEIFLKQFKRPIGELVEDIRQGSWMKFGAGKLRELSKHLPMEEEVKQLLAFRGDLCRLCQADLFMVLLVNVPSYEARIRSLILQEEFFPLLEEIKQSIVVMTTAAKELLDCDDLHSIIRLVLKVGNQMNDGGYAGSAIGFRMTSLLKVVDTKANKPDMNLMHYMAMQVQEINASLLKFPSRLKNIGAAARIQKQKVEADFKREVEKLKEAKEDSSKQPDLHTQTESFLQSAESRLAEVEVSLQALDSVSLSVAEFFCEDPNVFQLEECCSIFHSFCEKFVKAVQENREREVAELKQRQRLQNSAKRWSIATCSSLDRGKDWEGVALESILEKFLSGRGSRRRGGVAVGKTAPGAEPEPRTHPLRDGMNGWNSAQDLTAVGAPTGEGHPPCRLDERRERVASIDRKAAEKGRDRARDRRRTDFRVYPGRHSSLVEEEVEENEEQEAQRMREVSRRVLRYQRSRESLSPGERRLLEPLRGVGGAATSPRPHDGEAPPSTWTVLSPCLTPKAVAPTGPARRHSLAVPPAAVSPGDRAEGSPAPTVSPRAPPPPLALVGRLKSLDSCLSSPPLPCSPVPRTSTSLPECPA